MARSDDFETRRQSLACLNDEELKERFWALAGQVVTPLLELARTNTSPSIERSVLLRMGFSSVEAHAIVEKCLEDQLLGKGAGHVVWRLSRIKGITVREAGAALSQGMYWDAVKEFFKGRQVR